MTMQASSTEAWQVSTDTAERTCHCQTTNSVLSLRMNGKQHGLSEADETPPLLNRTDDARCAECWRHSLRLKHVTHGFVLFGDRKKYMKLKLDGLQQVQRRTVDPYALARKVHFYTTDFRQCFGVIMTMTFHIWTSKSNQFIFVPNCTEDVNLGEIPTSGL